MSNILLETNNLTCAFGGLKAVNEVTLQVKEGTILGLIGPNGAGKTTFFNMLTGLYKPTSGEILLEGKSINGLKPSKIAAMGICRTFQNLQLFNGMSVIDNIIVAQNVLHKISIGGMLFHTRYYHRIEEKMRERALEILDFIGMTDRQNDLPASLSYGHQRLLEIGRAMAVSPKLILLDEPAAGMNSGEIDELMEIILKVRAQGITIILIEHNMKCAMSICDYITVLDSGIKIAEGNPAEVQSNQKVIEAYLGKRGAANAGN